MLFLHGDLRQLFCHPLEVSNDFTDNSEGTLHYQYYYRPQTKFVKVMFLHLSVSHSVHSGRGCLPPFMLGYRPLPPDQRQTHPGTRGRHPSQTRGRPNPREQRQAPITPTPPPDQRQTPPEQCMLGDTGNKREVRILLECIRVETIV